MVVIIAYHRTGSVSNITYRSVSSRLRDPTESCMNGRYILLLYEVLSFKQVNDETIMMHYVALQTVLERGADMKFVNVIWVSVDDVDNEFRIEAALLRF